MNKLTKYLVVSALILSVWCLPTDAAMKKASLECADFGHIENEEINGEGACAATSMINSFVFLEKQYSNLFKNKLIPDMDGDGDHDENDKNLARKKLHVNIWGEDNSGGTIDLVWKEKVKWFEKYECLIDFHGMIEEDITGWYKTTGLTGNTFPTLNFLYEQIDKKQDVEIFVEKTAYDHALTLVSIEYDDVSNTGKICYVDSNDPVQCKCADVNLDGGKIKLTSTDGNNSTVIYGAFAECPEPATMGLLILGGLGVLIRRRRKA